MARTQIKVKAKSRVQRVRREFKSFGLRKRTLKRKLINKILLYSARKNRTKPLAAYSVLNPDTSSDSPSEKSKGVRLVSAIAEVSHKIAKIGLILTIGKVKLNKNEKVLKEEDRATNLRVIIANLTS